MDFNIQNLSIHLLILLITPPFFVGVINRIKSIFAGRKGPSLFQLYFDIFKLLKKDAVYSSSSSIIVRVAPIIIFIATLFSGILLPISGVAPVNFNYDIILFVYLFAMIRFIMIISSLDVGSSFTGMGASREAAFGAFSELTVFTALGTMVLMTDQFSLTDIFQSFGKAKAFSEPAVIFLFATFLFVLLTENSRMPVDDPNTHLELTMIHEVMILDYSGPDLGLILYSASVKLFLFMAFAVLFIFPNNSSFSLLESSGLMLVKIFGLSILIGIIESISSRVKLIKIPQLLMASFVLTIFALLIALFERGLL